MAATIGSGIGLAVEETTLATESIVLFRNSQGLESRGTLVRLTRNLAVFEVYNPHSIVQLSEVLSDIRIRRGERTTYKGRAVVSNLVSTGLLLLVSVTLVDPWSDLVDLAPGEELRREVAGFVSEWETASQTIEPAYALCVGQLRNFMQELSRWLEHGDSVAGIGHSELPDDHARRYAQDVTESAGPILERLLHAFEHQARQVAEDRLTTHKAMARRELHPLMLCSPFIHRTYTKPLGYAGDYEMVNMILGEPWRGGSTYARLINAAFVHSDVAVAHRHRIDLLQSRLEDEARAAAQAGRPFRVLNVGCGPAAEVQRFVQGPMREVPSTFSLLDFSAETLNYARGRMQQALGASGGPVEIDYVQRSIHDLLKQAAGRRTDVSEGYDMVYCAGLFDYLSDRICRRLMRLFFDWTVPGGLVLATNVHPRNPIRAIMEHIVEWYLIMRDQQDMLALAPGTGEASVYTEATGTNVFLEVRKPRVPASPSITVTTSAPAASSLPLAETRSSP